MLHSSAPSDHHEAFNNWANSQGIVSDGIKPSTIPDRGTGITASRKINAGDVLVKVPRSAVLSIESIPKVFRNQHKDITVHGLLASFLAFGKAQNKRYYSAWQATWPLLQDFNDTVPLLWNETDQDSKADNKPGSLSLLPPAIAGSKSNQIPEGILQKQKRKIDSDWKAVTGANPKADYETYLYYWLIVNTRSFYYELPGVKKAVSREDRMVLCPFIDFFNHSDNGCDVTFDESGFTVTSDRSYETDEEIFTSYGNHSNDFLMAEYGFILMNNRWDSIPLDDVLLPMLDEDSQRSLLQFGYMGNYTLSREGICYRTQIAINTQLLGKRQWLALVDGRLGEFDEQNLRKNSFICHKLHEHYSHEAEEKLKLLNEDKVSSIPNGIRLMLSQRWTQIKQLVDEAFSV